MNKCVHVADFLSYVVLHLRKRENKTHTNTYTHTLSLDFAEGIAQAKKNSQKSTQFPMSQKSESRDTQFFFFNVYLLQS